MQVGRQLARRREVVSERLLDDDALAGARQPGAGQALDHPREQRGRDLEIERGAADGAERVRDAAVGRGVAKIAADIAQSRGEPRKDLLVERLAGRRDRLAGAVHELFHRPVVDRDTKHRDVQQRPALEPVQRAKGHLPRQITGDPEDHESIGCGGLHHGPETYPL